MRLSDEVSHQSALNTGFRSTNKRTAVNSSDKSTLDLPRLLVVGECDLSLWSLSASERHYRAFARFNVEPLDNGDISYRGPIVAVRADYLLGQDIVAALIERPNIVLVADDPEIAVAAHVADEDAAGIVRLLEAGDSALDSTSTNELKIVRSEDIGSTYDNALRKRAVPVVLSYSTTPIKILEEKTFGAAYKGATDFVTKWVWPRPAKSVTRWAAARGISPNSITTASLVLVLLATWMFAQGYFLAAIPVAWAMTFLDTVDGKLARVTLTSSAWGNIYDHGIDLIHPPFWWWAWYAGALPIASANVAPWLESALLIIIAGYVLGRILEGLFVLMFKIETHIWRPIDYLFRTITARRNPNLAILMIATLLGRPDIGLLAVALWTIISLIFHAVRLCQAALYKARGTAIVSHLTQ